MTLTAYSCCAFAILFSFSSIYLFYYHSCVRCYDCVSYMQPPTLCALAFRSIALRIFSILASALYVTCFFSHVACSPVSFFCVFTSFFSSILSYTVFCGFESCVRSVALLFVWVWREFCSVVSWVFCKHSPKFHLWKSVSNDSVDIDQNALDGVPRWRRHCVAQRDSMRYSVFIDDYLISRNFDNSEWTHYLGHYPCCMNQWPLALQQRFSLGANQCKRTDNVKRLCCFENGLVLIAFVTMCAVFIWMWVYHCILTSTWATRVYSERGNIVAVVLGGSALGALHAVGPTKAWTKPG